MKTDKLRILILYHTNFGRNDGAPLYYWNVFNTQLKLKEVMHLAPQGDISHYGDFDYTFWVDYGEDGLPTDKEWKIPENCGKTIYVCSDAHIDDAGKDYRFNKAKEFDYVFFNQDRAKKLYRKSPKNKLVEWLPHAAEPNVYKKFDIIKRYDVCFIGHIQNVPNYNNITRIDFLHEMFAEFPNFYFGSRSPLDPTKNIFEDASMRFSESRIILNISITDDINMRVFEAMSSGSFLLTNWLPTLKYIGIDGEHFVTYKTIDEAKEKAHYYLEHEEEREKIAEAGHKHFLANHTYKNRIMTIFDKISIIS